MSLRLAVVLDGNPKGAKKALAETGVAIEDLGQKAKKAGNEAANTGKGFEWADDAPQKIGNVSSKARELGDELGTAATNGSGFSGVIEDAGSAASGAAPNFGKIAGSIKEIGVGFLTGLGVGVFTAALGTAVGAAADFVSALFSDQAEIEANLKTQAQLVRDIKAAYSEAEGAASSYGKTSTVELQYETQNQINDLSGNLQSEVDGLVNGNFFSRASAFSDNVGAQGGANDFLGPFRSSIEDFRVDLREGKADVTDFRREVAQIGAALPTDSPYRKLADTILDDFKQAGEIEAKLDRSRDLLEGLKGNADAAATALGGSAEKYEALGAASSTAAAPISETSTAISQTGEAASTASPGIDATANSIAKSANAASAALDPLRKYRELVTSLPSAPIGGAPTSVPSVPPRQFRTGDYTGDGDPNDPAGVVHKGEFVFTADETRRAGVGTLRSIARGLRGYASGGFVSDGNAGSFPAAPSGGSNVVLGVAQDFSLLRGSAKQFLNALKDGATGLDAFEGVVVSVAERWLDRFTSMIDDMIFGGGNAGGGGGAVFGNLFKSIFGGGSSPVFSSSVLAAAGTGLFRDAGYTGVGDDSDIAGEVHRNEFVFSAPATRRLGVGFLDKLHKKAKGSYRDGGLVDGNMSISGGNSSGFSGITINNNGTAQTASTREESDGRGGRRLVLQLEDMVGDALARPGSSARRTMGQTFGVKPIVTRR